MATFSAHSVSSGSKGSSDLSLISELDRCAKKLSRAIDSTERPIRGATTQIRYDPDSHKTMYQDLKPEPQRSVKETGVDASETDSFLAALDDEVKRSTGGTDTIASTRRMVSSPEQRRLFDAVFESESESDDDEEELHRSSSRESRRSVQSRKRRSVSRSTLRSVRGKGTRRRARSKVRSTRSSVRRKATTRRPRLSSKPMVTRKRPQVTTAKKVRPLPRKKVKAKSKRKVKKRGANKENTSSHVNYVQHQGVSQELLELRRENSRLKKQAQLAVKLRQERDRCKLQCQHAQAALTEQSAKGKEWRKRYKDLMHAKKTRTTSIHRQSSNQAKLRQSHTRLLGELRHTKLQLAEVKASEKRLKDRLKSANRDTVDLQRQVQLLKLRDTQIARRVSQQPSLPASAGRNVPRSNPEVGGDLDFGSNSVSSFESSDDDASDALDTSSRSIRSEPARNLKAYERYRKLKKVYMERYAS